MSDAAKQMIEELKAESEALHNQIAEVVAALREGMQRLDDVDRLLGALERETTRKA